MKWRKSSQQLIDTFQAVAPSPPAMLRKMFGYPAAFINGNMFMGLFEENMILRLPESDRTEMMKIKGARIFEPMPGRQMREYVVVPAALVDSHEALRPWIARALQYGETLKPKGGKSTTTRSGKAKLAKAAKTVGKAKKP
jgi:TfoX/Sxy family transcriptional regulator of competence genes